MRLAELAQAEVRAARELALAEEEAREDEEGIWVGGVEEGGIEPHAALLHMDHLLLDTSAVLSPDTLPLPSAVLATRSVDLRKEAGKLILVIRNNIQRKEKSVRKTDKLTKKLSRTAGNGGKAHWVWETGGGKKEKG